MGVVENIGIRAFPKQGDYVGRRVRVCFHYQPADEIGGTVVREDVEEPGRMIIRLDDGRYVLSTECMYSFPRVAPTAPVQP